MAWYTTAAAAVGIVSGLISIAKDLTSDDVDFTSISQKLDAILDSIESSKDQIIAEIQDLERRQISGSISGLVLTLRTYDRVPSDEPRLRRIIDDGAQLIGRLEEVLNDANNRSSRFTGALSMLLFISYLRAVAMVEREVLLRASNPELEDLPAMFRIVLEWLREAIVGVGDVNQRVQCTGETRTEGDTIVHGYRFDGNFVAAGFQIWEPIDRGIHEPPTRARNAAQHACERKREELLGSITDYQTELDRIQGVMTHFGL